MEKNYSSAKTYFPNLDGLRFLLAFGIMIIHIERVKFLENRPTIHIIVHYTFIGEYLVSIFFVLSGFLITYLLLKEKKEDNSINLRAYYARRMLRIWPLYYLILILGFFVFPYYDMYSNSAHSIHVQKHFWVYITGCFLLLSPIIRSAGGLPGAIGPIWSVGVEELFYLCWPLFLKKLKRYLLLFCGIIIFIIIIRNGLIIGNIVLNMRNSHETVFLFLREVIEQYRISCMAIGGIGAYLVVFEKNKILACIYRKDIQWITYIITFTLFLVKFGVNKYFGINQELYSILFVIIITNLATNPQSIINLNYKWMTYLGKISYGTYLYHYPIIRIVSLRLTEYVFKREISGWQMNIILYVITFVFTIFIATLSYEFFENYFMKMKRRYM
jgi:peptidoglycan/LPS O-acetylase OafA/YrhL